MYGGENKACFLSRKTEAGHLTAILVEAIARIFKL